MSTNYNSDDDTELTLFTAWTTLFPYMLLWRSLRTVKEFPLAISVLATDLYKAVILGVILTLCLKSRCFCRILYWLVCCLLFKCKL